MMHAHGPTAGREEGRRAELLGLDATIAQALADGIRYRQLLSALAAGDGVKRPRHTELAQAGLYAMAADELGLADQLAGIIDRVVVRRVLEFLDAERGTR
jgi:hypothetical protein